MGAILIRLEPSTPNCVHHTASCLAPIAILPFVGCKGGYPSVGLFSKFEVPKHEKKPGLSKCNQGFISQPVTGNRRAPVPVYRTGLTGYRLEPVEFKSKFK